MYARTMPAPRETEVPKVSSCHACRSGQGQRERRTDMEHSEPGDGDDSVASKPSARPRQGQSTKPSAAARQVALTTGVFHALTKEARSSRAPSRTRTGCARFGGRFGGRFSERAFSEQFSERSLNKAVQ